MLAANPARPSLRCVWIQNWLSLLPYLGPTATIGLGDLILETVDATRSETTIDDLEQLFPSTEPQLVRTAVIAALHRGLFSPTSSS